MVGVSGPGAEAESGLVIGRAWVARCLWVSIIIMGFVAGVCVGEIESFCVIQHSQELVVLQDSGGLGLQAWGVFFSLRGRIWKGRHMPAKY